MENSPWLSPGFLVPTAIALIGFVAWLIRLESKVNGIDKSMLKLDQSCEETWDAFDRHRSDGAIHFDQRLATRVEQQQSDRMGRMEGDLKEIKDLVKSMASK